MRSKIGLNKHLYYCSQGLKRAEIICEGKLIKDLNEDFSNDYVKMKTLRNLAEDIMIAATLIRSTIHQTASYATGWFSFSQCQNKSFTPFPQIALQACFTCFVRT